MSPYLSLDPAVATIQVGLLLVLFVLLGVATHLMTLLIIRACSTKRKISQRKISPQAREVHKILRRLRDHQSTSNHRNR